jgi:UMF1 family MFS transporter
VAEERLRKSAATRREILGWAMFDFANSSYTTVIVTVVFSVVFPRLVVGDGPEFKRGNLLWSLALAVSYALVALTAPLFGAIMDYRASKKRFLFVSWLGTVLATAGLYFAEPGQVPLAFALVVLSNFGFAAGESFVAAFLPELGPREALGRISGFAWGLGYLGGVASTALVLQVIGDQTLENYSRVRLVGPLTAAFFFFAALPTFAFLRERGVPRALPPGESLLALGFARLRTTSIELSPFGKREGHGAFRDLTAYFASYLFSQAGLSIVISFAFIYGDQVVRWSKGAQALMFVLTNLSAAAGAVLFGRLQSRWGNVRTYNLTLVVWMLAVLGIWGTPRLTVALAGVGFAVRGEQLFLAVGVLAGLCLGATQSAGRTLVAVFAPESKAAELFGFWGVFGKVASIVGLLAIGALQSVFGLEASVLVCVVFFVLAFVLGLRIDEARGIAAARAHEGE